MNCSFMIMSHIDVIFVPTEWDRIQIVAGAPIIIVCVVRMPLQPLKLHHGHDVTD